MVCGSQGMPVWVAERLREVHGSALCNFRTAARRAVAAGLGMQVCVAKRKLRHARCSPA